MTAEQVRKLASELKDTWGKVYSTFIPIGVDRKLGHFFIFRRISCQEYEKINERVVSDPSHANDADELVCKKCTLYPANMDPERYEAGVAKTLAAAIISTSGFDKQEEILNKYRSKMNTLGEQIVAIVCDVHRMTRKEVMTLSMDELLERYAEAEWVIKVLRGVQLVENNKKKVSPKDPVAYLEKNMKNTPAEDDRIDHMHKNKDARVHAIQERMARRLEKERSGETG